ncbi:hypothetical protein [Streptomyces sp. CMB-StM0423]|uniref:hypothetical protein n=1 Tax=Streptomyces sp. CMB-StM0423 TaxID=2059884 RepID=UPI00131AD5DA|nr:hypothetical protein [Streptomyces sp. CMB-StM0423]
MFASEFPYVIPKGDVPQGAQVSIVMRQLQAFIPLPREAGDGQEAVAVVTMLTPAHAHWDLYAGHAVEVLRSLEFDEPRTREDRCEC